METSPSLRNLLDRHQAGDDSAREGLIQHALERCRFHAHRMLQQDNTLRKIDNTDDVVQKSLIRLHKALADHKPTSAAAFFGLATRQTRWVLKDIAREVGRTKAVAFTADELQPKDPGIKPEGLLAWAEFHEKVEKLPDECLEAFDLIYYQGLSQPKAAEVLGISLRTLKYRWQAARLKLQESLGGFPDV